MRFLMTYGAIRSRNHLECQTMTRRMSPAALSAIACLSLAACGLTLDVGEGYPPAEADYLRDLHNNDELLQETVWITNDDSDQTRADYVALGYAICTAFGSGQNFLQVQDALNEQFPRAPEVRSLAMIAHEHLCPDAILAGHP